MNKNYKRRVHRTPSGFQVGQRVGLVAIHGVNGEQEAIPGLFIMRITKVTPRTIPVYYRLYAAAGHRYAESAEDNFVHE